MVVKTIKLSKAGYPDIFMFKNGRTIFVEVKSEKGVVSELQKFKHKEIEAQGFKVYVINNFEEWKEYLKLENQK